jgi:hypothetical protein
VLAYHRLQNEVLRHGLDGLPHLPAEKTAPRKPPQDPLVRDLQQPKTIAPWSFLFSGE